MSIRDEWAWEAEVDAKVEWLKDHGYMDEEGYLLDECGQRVDRDGNPIPDEEEEEEYREDGTYESYYDNGQLREKFTFKDNKLEGPYESYWDNGQLCIKCTYVNDEPVGLYEWYEKDGKLIQKCVYKYGESFSDLVSK